MNCDVNDRITIKFNKRLRKACSLHHGYKLGVFKINYRPLYELKSMMWNLIWGNFACQNERLPEWLTLHCFLTNDHINCMRTYLPLFFFTLLFDVIFFEPEWFHWFKIMGDRGKRHYLLLIVKINFGSHCCSYFFSMRFNFIEISEFGIANASTVNTTNVYMWTHMH